MGEVLGTSRSNAQEPRETPMVVASLFDLVGQTPLIRIHARWMPPDIPMADVWAKMEQLNVGGSVKDRISLAMIEDAEARGELKRPGTVVEPTSGNTGIGLAMVCAAKGHRVIFTMPEDMSLERRRLLQAYGATVVLTPARELMQGAIDRAQVIMRQTPGAFMPYQFHNQANPAVHTRTTAREILDAMEGLSIDAIVSAVGTGGTVTGVGAELRAEFPEVRIVAVEPESCAWLSRKERGPHRIQGIGSGNTPRTYCPPHPTELRTVTDEDAWRTKLRLGRYEGLFTGVSAGANVFIALQVAQELGRGRHVVTFLCDGGERYFGLRQQFRGIRP